MFGIVHPIHPFVVSKGHMSRSAQRHKADPAAFAEGLLVAFVLLPLQPRLAFRLRLTSPVQNQPLPCCSLRRHMLHVPDIAHWQFHYVIMRKEPYVRGTRSKTVIVGCCEDFLESRSCRCEEACLCLLMHRRT